MKIDVIITQNNPEQVFTALRFANFALKEGDQVSIFLAAEGVELEKIKDPRFDVLGQAESFIQDGGKIQACGSCLKLRDSAGSDVCPLSTMQEMYTIVKEAERVVTF
jgi:uncharacterized protein involved in oxidation of intracellular sulfur